jgi:homoserine dehydrogenase
MSDKQFNIGLFGFGTVGRGLFEVLQRVGMQQIVIKRICVRNLRKPRAVQANFTDCADDIFNDTSINLIVELIDDADAAYAIVKRALQQGIPVVSGNKKMLAYHLEELIDLQREYHTALLYDASACGSIPVIRNLEEYYDNDLLISVKGILNGSSNFILSKIFNENMGYAEALQLAQKAGFAESNPSLDIDGWDSLFKLVIITMHAFGLYVAPERIFTFGIGHTNDEDIRFALEKGRRIKLVAHVEKLPDNRLIMSVMPQLLSRNKYIYNVEDEFNGVVIKGLFYDKQFMFGRGAGGYATGSAVLSDITACLFDYRYEYKKRSASALPSYTTDYAFRVYFRYTHNDDLELLHFDRIDESHISAQHKYVVGIVSLSELYRAQQTLRERDIFVAAYPTD